MGTHTGIAYNQGGHVMTRAWESATAKEIALWGKTRMRRRCDFRITRFFHFLHSLPKFDIVVFEDILFSSSTYQVQLWASLRGALWCVFGPEAETNIECVPSSTLKKFATNHGGADKMMMRSSLYKFWPEWKSATLSEDEVDALWLWYWADKHLTHGK